MVGTSYPTAAMMAKSPAVSMREAIAPPCTYRPISSSPARRSARNGIRMTTSPGDARTISRPSSRWYGERRSTSGSVSSDRLATTLHPSLEHPEGLAGTRAQCHPVDLAGAAERRLIDEAHLSGKRVRGAALQEEPLQVLRRCGPSIVEDHEGDRGFALDRVRDRHHERLADRRLEEQHVLDLLRVYVLPADVDHVVHAAQDRVVAVLVGPHEVAGR